MNVLIICDAPHLLDTAYQLLRESNHNIDIVTSERNIDPTDWDVIWSFHCRKILPPEFVNQAICINIHPGYNPYNRGMFPHVYSIMNGYPCGVTIHYINENIDDGAIIKQELININDHETSKEVYDKIVELEKTMLIDNFDSITSDLPKGNKPEESGNINYLKDYKKLCNLNMDGQGSLRDHINLLRALTHGDYDNAYFYDEDGNKVFVTIKLKRE
jgi:methionyl-tRNA formyltransferase